ncbi:MAG: DNA polymerase III subunit delta' [Halanaerobiales bacterium]
MSFKNIPGQSKTKRILQDTIKKGRISHAYLFTGNKGLGKSEMAREFAQAIFCDKNLSEGCGQCISCKKFTHGNHPDFQVVKVQEDHKSILIDQIRELQKEISYKPYESDYKIYIIDDAARMTEQAQNSLLKTLEEPPEYAIIILTNEDKNDLISTIVSRCQEVKLYNQPEDIIERYLQEEKSFDREEASLYATLARGKYKKAVKLALKEGFIDKREKIINFIISIDEKDNFEIYDISEEFKKISESDFPLFELLLSIFRDILVLKQDGTDGIINFDYQELIADAVDKFNIDDIFELTNHINLYKDYYYRNIKKELLFASLLFKIRAKKQVN